MLTAYCKKCKQDVTPGDACPLCGGKLTKAALHVHWEMTHDPVKDWMCWNSAARIVLPVVALAAAVLIGLEALSGGAAAVQKLLEGGFLHILGGLVLIFFLAVWLVLLLQGEETIACAVDSNGAHVTQYLDSPTPLQLAMRLKPAAQGERVLVGQKDIPWKDIARVQLWEDKLLILFYAPKWWMRLALPVTPDEWPAAIMFLHDKLGKKKNVSLPEIIRTPGEAFAAMATTAPEPAPEPRWETEPLPPEEPAWLPVEEPLPFPEEAPAPADALPEDQVAGGEQGSMFDLPAE